jgi:AmmeMemoRadiSam system protein B
VTIRPPAVAGRFYPDDPAQLRRLVRRYLDAAPAAALPGRVKVVIAPHAGYPFSGPVAGAAFRPLAAPDPELARVVLIGPAHWVPVQGVGVSRADAFATPLGLVPVDRDAVAALLDWHEAVAADRAHAPEHALEVELPFLQVLKGGVPIVPLLCGECDDAAVTAALRRLWGGPETLIVVSSDLSHYEPYDAARAHDARTAAAIEALEPGGLGPFEACGFRAIRAALALARECHLVPVRLALANSGDTAGPRDSVVGYGAWAFCEAAGDR